MEMCNENEQCKAFSYVNLSPFRLHKPDFPNTCLLKTSCLENILDKNLSGIYIYFEGLTETGK